MTSNDCTKQRETHRVDIRHSPELVRMRSKGVHPPDSRAGSDVRVNHPSVVRILTTASDGTQGTYAAGNWGGCGWSVVGRVSGYVVRVVAWGCGWR